MNPQPVSYLQTDPRWKSVDYSAAGESTTIGASGCGPTAMAMVLATWADPNVTPKTECAWALAHGYKAPHSGTYYGYFVPAAARYGLRCQRLNTVSIYGNSGSAHHNTVREALARGCLVIACMGKGNWTSSGHYILVYDIDTKAGVVYINDPASTKTVRVHGNYSVFRTQVKYYWVIEPPEEKEEDDVTLEEVKNYIDELSNEEAWSLLKKAFSHAKTLPEPAWSQQEGHWQDATGKGIVDGTNPEGYAKRDEVVAILGRLNLLE